MQIRPENITDYPKITLLIEQAFAKATHRDGNEAQLVEKLRHSQNFIPELSLVAVSAEQIVGHILFTKVTIENHQALALAPLAVLPEFQKQGIGSALIKAGHIKAQELGYTYSIVLGHPGYYSRFGYRPASSYDIKAPFTVSDEFFMAAKLSPNAPVLSGIVHYDEAFGL
ncbi:GNAT family N-acetyltransferase [Ligilactobacillus faecis]|uniref:GNAT family N-acetyltransferase n=1 Tax=Ligilactobacillus faecis TaxID=762833 RepID=UPI002468F576|nr:N-acetyltransferase [Ligilactobacillus faecis]WGN90383.1 N-acetyltransferase [Ligilactobacillus faecis]